MRGSVAKLLIQRAGAFVLQLYVLLSRQRGHMERRHHSIALSCIKGSVATHGILWSGYMFTSVPARKNLGIVLSNLFHLIGNVAEALIL